jgi:hypothetical protein
MVAGWMMALRSSRCCWPPSAKSREGSAIELAFGAGIGVGQHHGRTELRDDGLVDRLARLHQRARDGVGLEDVGAEAGEEAGSGRLAAAQAAGEADAQHA